jgi:hypothetical protein
MGTNRLKTQGYFLLYPNLPINFLADFLLWCEKQEDSMATIENTIYIINKIYSDHQMPYNRYHNFINKVKDLALLVSRRTDDGNYNSYLQIMNKWQIEFANRIDNLSEFEKILYKK